MFAIFKMTSKKYRFYMFVSIIFTAINVLLALLFSRLNASFIPLLLSDKQVTQIKIDFLTFAVSGRSHAIWLLSGLILANTILGFMCTIFSIVYSAKSFSNITRELRSIIFAKIQKMPIQDIDNITVGALMTRVTSDAMMVGMIVQTVSRTLVTAPIMLIGACALALVVNIEMSFFLAILIPIIFGVVLIITFTTRPLIRKRRQSVDIINNESRENILGVRVVKSYNLENKKRENYNKSVEKWTKLSIRINSVFWVIFPVVWFTINMLVSGILIYGGNKVLDPNKEMDAKYLESMVVFIDFMILIAFSILQLSQIIFITIRGQVASKRINDVLNSKNAFDDVVSDKIIKNPSIEFKNVTFKYHDVHNEIPSSENVLENVSFKIKPYQTLGIVGNSGSGKSTIANLLVRNFLPDQGQILIDNMDINEIDTKNLNANISMTFQDAVLNSGTIKENLLFANEHATQQEIEIATKAAMAHSFIDKFEDKYNHEIVQRGKNLSGGQKQRISIARSLLKKSKILILDDSTSALDALTEKAVKSNIRDNYKLTTIIISQKISAVRDCDNIIVLDNAKVVASGTHTQLLQSSPEYQTIVKEQQGGV
ncbi:ABC-type multidrug/protein/lipid transport system ATPase component [Mycoplasmopsis californica]|uniref:ABC transporter ATP-binding protein/permease n=1 Tax=Mycoplasmopsis equigenitalium TaxID=114883 RepID=A0ABY5J182_9BACT|nr:ABC transporter ATP-binding protein [Mycoplasmopsis equigenitalium]UUD37004.1 ABC transporter ATP-binding protein/permease [Mycoplasmopsis equigenitalium]VEU69698.1 ABC-type multidrug/protein/lipid transport system ATPase component [Mycoplasmopsis californica]